MDNEFRTRVMRRIRDRIAMLDVASSSLETALGVNQSSASRIKNGKMLPDAEKLPALARLLGTSCDYLLCNTNDPAPIDANRFMSRFAYVDRVLESVIEATGALRQAIISEDDALASLDHEQDDSMTTPADVLHTDPEQDETGEAQQENGA